MTDGQQGGQVTEVFRKAVGRAAAAWLAEGQRSVFSMEVKWCERVCVCVSAHVGIPCCMEACSVCAYVFM